MPFLFDGSVTSPLCLEDIFPMARGKEEISTVTSIHCGPGEGNRLLLMVRKRQLEESKWAHDLSGSLYAPESCQHVWEED